MQRAIKALIFLSSGLALTIGFNSSVKADRSNEGSVAATTRPAAAKHDFAKWERAIAAFERSDRQAPPKKGGIEFIGSSTIARWKTLAQDFPDHPVFNRGFGGSEIEDATHFAERIIFPYEPRMVLLRSGGNDINAGKSVERVFNDYKAFVKKVHERLPDTKIVFIALSPAPSRWNERNANKELNQRVRLFTKRKPYLDYVDAYDISLTRSGEAREELFVSDKLHFNAEGYKLLTERVRPVLKKVN